MEEISHELEKYNKINKIDAAVHNPIVKSFLSTVTNYIPFIGEWAIEEIDASISKYQEQKRKKICEIIFESPELITIDKVQDADFIIAFARLLDTVNRLNSNKKIEYLANLFKNTFVLCEVNKINEFEEGLSRLSDLSEREMEILMVMNDTEYAFYEDYWYGETPQALTHEFFQKSWEHTLTVCVSRFELSKPTMTNMISSLTRTGFIDTIDIMRSGSSSKVYLVSHYFKRFLTMIRD